MEMKIKTGVAILILEKINFKAIATTIDLKFIQCYR